MPAILVDAAVVAATVAAGGSVDIGVADADVAYAPVHVPLCGSLPRSIR